MRFALDLDLQDFAASLDSMLAAADVPQVSRLLASGDVGAVRVLWKALSDLGVTGLMIDREHDGLGAEPLGMVVALEGLGRWAVPGPVVESVVAVPTLLTQMVPRTPEEADRWLTQLASGDVVATLSVLPRTPRALDPDLADLVLTVEAGNVGIGTVAERFDSIDPSRKLGRLGLRQQVGVIAAVDDVETLASLACAAQLLGAGHALLDRAAEYAKSRRQFGQRIGTFQAVKHALADVLIGLEMARPLLYNAALSVGSHSPDARRDVSAAKVACGEAAYRASRTALQVHGAIGYTMEYDLSLWITKVRALQSSWGTAAAHRKIVLEAL